MGRQSRQAEAQPPELTASSYKRLLNADYGTANSAAGRITAKLTQVHPPNLVRGPLAACQIKSGCKQDVRDGTYGFECTSRLPKGTVHVPLQAELVCQVLCS